MEPVEEQNDSFLVATRILIADDHEVVREGLRAFLTRVRPKWQICGLAANGEQAIRAIRDSKPDMVVMDITMPDISGLEACSCLRVPSIRCPRLRFEVANGTGSRTGDRHAPGRGHMFRHTDLG